MQKINFDKKIIAFSLLIAVIVIEILILLPWSIKRVIGLNKKIALIGQQIKSTENDWPRLNEYSKVNQELKNQIENSRSKLILSQEASESLSFISTASKEFGVEIKSFLPGELINYLAESEENLFYLPISIEAKAKFHNLALFLEYLQTSQYFFDIKELKVSSDYPYNSIEIVVCAIAEK
ncbi:MAG: type 4a pilus biogenesis protein PilO [Candidatus Omnitrophica bacterium]|nr:type 4a pilus biogenesis protein PilO [Candidatus Omnitrophota bacterium]